MNPRHSKPGYGHSLSFGWYICLVALLCAFSREASAQAPINDNCNSATQITIGNKGYATGVFSSPKINMTDATRQSGESFPLLQFYAGTDKKTAWFSFNLPVHRQINVQLRQKDSGIAQDAVGFSVYKASNCLPNLGEIASQLPVLSKFGSSNNTCLEPGYYLIQVSAKQSADDSIWIDLGVLPASDAKFDQAINAYDMGVVQGTKTISYDIGCLSIDDTTETCASLGANAKDYNQSSWVCFKTPVYSDAFNFSFNITNKFTADSIFGFNVYEGNSAQGTPLKLLNGCNLVTMPSGNVSSFYYAGTRLFCTVKPNTSYTLQIFFWKESQCNLSVIVSDFGFDTAKAADPKNLPKSYQLGNIKSGVTKAVDDYLACNARMSLHPCGKDQPPYFVDSISEYNYTTGTYYYIHDTLDLATWLTFSVAEEGNISIATTVTPCNINYPEYLLRYYNLYQGDITKDCNLTKYYSGYANSGTCIEPGTYSYQVVGSSDRHLSPDFCMDVDLGKIVTTSIGFVAKAKQAVSKYYLPPKAEDLGDISATLQSKGIAYAKQDFFDSLPSKDTVMGNPLYYYVLYRQFYLSHPANIQVKNEKVTAPYATNTQWDGYLLYGKATDGLKTLSYVNGDFKDNNSSDYYQDTCFFRSGCSPLPAGWYTVISTYRSNSCGLPAITANNIAIDTFGYCQASYNRPYKAAFINNLNPLPQGSTSLPRECKNCASDTPFLNKMEPCVFPKYKNFTKVSYCVFYIDHESYMIVNSSGAPYLLYRGNVRYDSSILGNPAKLISPCANSNQYCRLQPGEFTIVIFTSAAGQYNLGSVYIDQTVYSKFDYAKNASDMGMIPMDGSAVISAEDDIGCTTGAFASDPGFNAYDTATLYYGLGKSSVPIPMPVNYNKTDVVDTSGAHRDRPIQRNVWYTFTLTGTGYFDANVFYGGANLYNSQKPYILRTPRNGSIPFSTLVANNQVDSTMVQGLKGVATILINGYPYYTKTDCDTGRYYALVYYPSNSYGSLNNKVNITVSYNGIAFPKLGDYCSNAIPMQLNSYGNVTGTATVNCHTTGESYGEDGSNMACLDQGKPYKTTWFKFTEKTSNRFDLTFILTNHTNVPNNQISYRVLYGNCDAMTPGPCVGDGNASFTLDCMSKGDYYIQVSEPVSASGDISIIASVSPPKFPSCKPSNLFQPLANFYTTGGCNSKSVNFINLSTSGNAIKYEWDFGNGTTSTQKQPTITYKPIKSIDTFYVKLKVTDTVHQRSDSLTLPVYVFNAPVTLSVTSPVGMSCNGQAQLHATCSYPNALYHWVPEGLLDNAYIANPIAKSPKDTMFYLTVKAENCTLYDSVKLTVDHGTHISTDDGFCTGSKATLLGPSGYISYSWYDGKNHFNTQDLIITKPGIYSLVATNAIYCMSYDTIKVTGKGIDSVRIGKDTAICAGQNITLTAPMRGSYRWNTGDTTQSIVVGKPGFYSVEIKLGLCTVYGTINVTFHPFPKINIGKHDTAFCEGDSAVISVGYLPGTRYHWTTGDTTSTITVHVPGIYQVKVSLGYCDTIVAKQVSTSPLPHPNLGKDTVSCFLFEKTLDAGPGLFYKWFPGGDTTRFISVRKEGKYAVMVSNGPGCASTDTILLTMHCDEATLYVPNAFTPDGKNEVFKAIGTHINDFKMTVYNRWGELIFESDDINNGWDGKFRKEAVPMDVYIWIITYKAYETAKIAYGNVTLLR